MSLQVDYQLMSAADERIVELEREKAAAVAYAGELRSTMNEMLDLYDMHLRWGEIIERARKLTTPEGGGRNG